MPGLSNSGDALVVVDDGGNLTALAKTTAADELRGSSIRRCSKMTRMRKDQINDLQPHDTTGQNSSPHHSQPRAKLRDQYASCADFCQVFASDMKRGYLLAFLLTANHRDAERCFVKLEGFPEWTVFKDRVSSWIRRSLIKAAIHLTFRQSGHEQRPRDHWWGGQTTETVLINAVTQLASLDRFVFVMSVLEGYSIKECSLLLDCTERAVIEAKIHALHELPFLPSPTSEIYDNHTDLETVAEAPDTDRIKRKPTLEDTTLHDFSLTGKRSDASSLSQRKRKAI